MSKFLTVKCLNTQPSEATMPYKDYIYRAQSPTKRPQTHGPNLNTQGRHVDGKGFVVSAPTPANEMEYGTYAETTGINKTLLKSMIREVLDEIGISDFIKTQETRYLETQKQLRQLTQTLAKVRDVLEANSDDILNLQEQIDDTRQAIEVFKEETKSAIESVVIEHSDMDANGHTPCLLSIQKELADIRFELSAIKTVSKFF